MKKKNIERNKQRQINVRDKNKKIMVEGITLVALVITIIVLIILAGVTIGAVTNHTGIFVMAKNATIASEFSKYVEEFNLFKTEKAMDLSVDSEGNTFKIESLTAGKEILVYNTESDKEKESGTIKNVIPDLSEKYMPYFSIIKGELLFNAEDTNLLQIAKNVGIKENPYDIIDGELVSSDKNLALVDENGEIVIPATVTSIGQGTFANIKKLKNVEIPYTVKEIKDNAFSNNETLESVEFLTRTKSDGTIEGCKKIGNGAFNNCINLSNMKLPKSLETLGNSAFRLCDSLKEIEIPEKVEEIPNSCFFSNPKKGLEKITLHDGNLKRIDDCAFEWVDLKEIDLPNSVNYIGRASLYGCFELKNVKIRGKNVEIDIGALNNSAIEKLETYNDINNSTEGNLKWVDKNILMDDKSVVFMYQSYLNQITEYTMPDTVERWNYALALAPKLTKITLSSKLKEINMQDVTFPGTVEWIDTSKNSNFKVLNENGEIASENANVNKMLCDKDNNLIYYLKINGTEITIPKEINSVGIRSMATIGPTVINANCKKLGCSAIYWGNGSKYILNIGSNVEYIDPLFPCHAKNYTINIDHSNPYYIAKDGFLFRRHYSVDSVGNKKFDNTYSLAICYNTPEAGKDVTIEIPTEINGVANTKVTEIGAQAFFEQTTITRIEIPSTIEKIGDESTVEKGYPLTWGEEGEDRSGSFNSCTNLKEIIIPKGVKFIGKYNFSGCINLEHIYIYNKIEGAPWGATKGMKAVKYK